MKNSCSIQSLKKDPKIIIKERDGKNPWGPKWGGTSTARDVKRTEKLKTKPHIYGHIGKKNNT